HVYGGAYTQTVFNRWNSGMDAWHQYLATRGLGVLVLDNRLSGARSLKTVRSVQGRLGQLELSDLQAGVDWLKTQPWVDASRLGIWGWSYGGYMTAMALAKLTAFVAGAAVAPVSDWQLYNTWYT